MEQSINAQLSVAKNGEDSVSADRIHSEAHRLRARALSGEPQPVCDDSYSQASPGRSIHPVEATLHRELPVSIAF
jgi:hypothetical protein